MSTKQTQGYFSWHQLTRLPSASSAVLGNLATKGSCIRKTKRGPKLIKHHEEEQTFEPMYLAKYHLKVSLFCLLFVERVPCQCFYKISKVEIFAMNQTVKPSMKNCLRRMRSSCLSLRLLGVSRTWRLVWETLLRRLLLQLTLWCEQSRPGPLSMCKDPSMNHTVQSYRFVSWLQVVWWILSRPHQV